jgi:hypothetical protein
MGGGFLVASGEKEQLRFQQMQLFRWGKSRQFHCRPLGLMEYVMRKPRDLAENIWYGAGTAIDIGELLVKLLRAWYLYPARRFFAPAP